MRRTSITTITALAITALSATMPTAASAQGTTTIELVQGIPGPPNVDVEIDGVTEFADVASGAIVDITDYAGLTLPDLTVFETGTATNVLGPEDVSVPSTGNNSIALTVSGAMTFTNDTSEVASGTARVTLRNTSDAPSVSLIGTSRTINALTPGSQGSTEQTAGQLSGARITGTGGAPLVDVPTMNLSAGTNTVLYVIGTEADGLEVITQVIEVPVAPEETTTTTTVAGQTTSTTTSTSTTVAGVPSAVNTGSPLDDGSSSVWILVVVGGLAVAGGAVVVRRRL